MRVEAVVSVARALSFVARHASLYLERYGLGRYGLIPTVLVAAAMLVLGYRLLRRSARLAVEVALVAALLLVANELFRLGWLRW